jgi:hypothetical protein
MKSVISNHTLHRAAVAVASVAACAAVHAADVNQIATGAANTDWNNTAVWGSAPVSGNNYFTVASGATATTRLGTGSAVGWRVRDNGTTFGGDLLTIAGATELLLKQTGDQVSTGNIVLNGGVVRLSTAASSKATLAGSLHVAAESWLGVADTGTPVLTVNSAVSGDSVLHLATGLGAGTVRFTGDLSGFSGTFRIGGGESSATVSFGQSYALPSASVSMGQYSTTDILNLNGDLTVGAFSFGATVFEVGSYSLAALNGSYGNGSQFTGTGNLIVGAIPEPSSSAVLAGLVVAGAVLSRRRRHG